MPRTILLTGVTGNQGGATVRALAGSEFALRGLTRNPAGPKARALAELGIAPVEGDLTDPDSLRQALQGVWGVFSVQTPFESGVGAEVEQGILLARLAREAGVAHFVYSSVAAADRHTGIPHFESKARIEETVRKLSFPSFVILRPAFFMENLVSPWFLQGNALLSALHPETSLQMIAVRDVGKYAALAFTNAERLNRRELDIAGDEATLPAAALALSEGLGRPIEAVSIPLSEVRKRSEDVALMYEWFERVGFDIDIEALEREFGLRSTKLVNWAREQHP